MQAVIYSGPHSVEVTDRSEPTLPDRDSVLVRVTASGICGSDLHTYEGHAFGEPGFSLGHEAVGRVVEVGAGVRTVGVGDRVLVAGSAGCLRCRQCAEGWVMGCTGDFSGVYGVGMGLDGLQAEFAVVRNADRNVAAIPDGVTDDDAVLLTDNLPTGWCGARQARVRPGATVAVVGLGPVGLSAVMSAMVMGAGRVLAIDPLPDRRDAAERLGAEGVFGDDVIGLVNDLTGGKKADCVIEAVGATATIDTAIRLAGTGGSVAVAGVPADAAMQVPVMDMFIAQISLNSALCSVQRELPTLIPLVERGRLHPARLVTHHFGLSDAPKAYKTFAERQPGTGKVVFTVDT